MARVDDLLAELAQLVPTDQLQVRESPDGAKHVLLLGWYPVHTLHNIVQLLLDDITQVH